MASQIALVVCLSIALAHGVTVGAFYLLRPVVQPPILFSAAAQIATLARVVDRLPLGQRAEAVALGVDRPGVALRLGDVPEPEDTAAAEPSRDLRDLLRRHLGEGWRVVALASRPDAGLARSAIALEDGSWLVAEVVARGISPFLLAQLILSLAVAAVVTACLSVWATRRLIRPLSRFAETVDAFDLEAADHPVAREGSQEVRQVVAAFERMRERIIGAVKDRTDTLAAISHDLRTPLARLRLRVEGLDDEAEQAALIRDVDRLERLVVSALSFLRGQRQAEPVAAIDLPSLLQTVCDDQADLGHVISYEGPDRLVWSCRPDAMTRAVVNLVDNAVEHGAHVVVRLGREDGGDGVVIEVEDDGPGIPPAERERVFEPFVRRDEARGREGFGLGLPIVRSIVAQEGGDVALLDGARGGTVARIRLPGR
ncbi:ATP-binding protein [Marinivivus vitaminiproducens]|uniref:ATP-binding protein n=1 Tax=Marinivivus vitaminiproducens TaxID=3035935 RepID=UPI0027A1A713|nr:ATP-binding protein [Geminicoccaceae bacterium SCSIO 64248]